MLPSTKNQFMLFFCAGNLIFVYLFPSFLNFYFQQGYVKHVIPEQRNMHRNLVRWVLERWPFYATRKILCGSKKSEELWTQMDGGPSSDSLTVLLLGLGLVDKIRSSARFFSYKIEKTEYSLQLILFESKYAIWVPCRWFSFSEKLPHDHCKMVCTSHISPSNCRRELSSIRKV